MSISESDLGNPGTAYEYDSKIEYLIYTVYYYQQKVSPEEWGPVETRYNGRQFLSTKEELERYVKTYSGKLGVTQEFQGVYSYGYRWTDVRIEVQKTATTSTVSTYTVAGSED